MIDEKKLIEHLQKCVNASDNTNFINGLLSSIDIVKLQPQSGQWIPCSERLPESDNYILLSFENFSVPLVGRYEEDQESGAFYVGDDAESCGSQDIIVNAWMPLPEQYREEY